MWSEKGKSIRGHLTYEEKGAIYGGFKEGRPVPEVAAELGRSRRIVQHYYLLFRGRPLRSDIRHKPKVIRASVFKDKKPLTNPARFYHSNFEPE